MDQLTKEQAIEFAQSGVWKEWTPDQIVRFQLFQDLLCLDFSVYHAALEEVLGRPVWTHEMANWEALQQEYLGMRPPPTMQEIVDLIPPEKRLVINSEPG